MPVGDIRDGVEARVSLKYIPFPAAPSFHGVLADFHTFYVMSEYDSLLLVFGTFLYIVEYTTYVLSVDIREAHKRILFSRSISSRSIVVCKMVPPKPPNSLLAKSTQG